MILAITHTTEYHYSEPLKHAIQTLCLTPRSSAHQTVQQWQVSGPGRLFASTDGFGNCMHTCTLARRAVRGRVHAHGVVSTHASPWTVDEEPDMPPPWLYLRPTPLACAHAPLHQWARSLLAPAQADAAAVLQLAAGVRDRVRYEPGQTSVHTTAPQAFDHGSGVCQDQAHVFVAACRSLGLPARYVSGYFHAPGAPALASHAWAEVCLDTQARRWLGMDITHACAIDERHVRLAVGPDYAACAPVRGMRSGGGEERMEVSVSISRADA
ncbi:transglutaminase family protein [Ideonella sp. BN130291]|uniref:transglutaminase family protein n=1 Tax=Ideonella sp. BN130291 TaxID=3112940 RepID=UPI002E2613CC|nr:transglutaminase family protein [Ideonella sp. BN130291]